MLEQSRSEELHFSCVPRYGGLEMQWQQEIRKIEQQAAKELRKALAAPERFGQEEQLHQRRVARPVASRADSDK